MKKERNTEQKEILIKYEEWKNNGNYGEFRY